MAFPASGSWAEELTDAEREAQAEELYDQASDAYDEERFTEAIVALEEALGLSPQYVKAFQLMVRARSYLEEWLGIPDDKEKDELTGRVIDVGLDPPIVGIDLGTDDGLHQGMRVEFVREGEVLGDTGVVVEPGKNVTQLAVTESVAQRVATNDTVAGDLAYWRFQQGAEAYQRGEYAQAIDAFGHVILYSPGHAGAFHNLGLAWGQREEWRRAHVALQEAVTFHPFSEALVAREPLVRGAMGDAGAVEALNEYLREHPTDADARFMLGLLSLEQGSTDLGLQHLTAVRNLRPSNAEVLVSLGLGFLLKERPHKALQRFEDVGDLKLVSPLVRSLRWVLSGWAWMQLNEPDKAARAWEQVQDESISRWASADADQAEMAEDVTARIRLAHAKNTLAGIDLEPYQQPVVSQRRAQEILAARAALQPVVVAPTSDHPLGAKFTFTETFEHYNRDPSTAFPASGSHLISNVKIENELRDVDVTGELQLFRNHWDGFMTLDYYKVNIENEHTEIDVGEFSVAHFSDLVKHGELKRGYRYHHTFSRGALTPDAERFEPPDVTPVGPGMPVTPAAPLNIGRVYNDEFIDRRIFKETSITLVGGVGRRSNNIGEKKEENDNTFSTTGQFRRDIFAARIQTLPTDNSSIGFSAVKVKDAIGSALTSDTTNPVNNIGYGADAELTFFDDRLELTGEIGWTDHDPDQLTDRDESMDVASLASVSLELTDQIDMSYDRKRIGEFWKLEGASQTQNRNTNTWKFAYAASEDKPWRTKSFDLKYELSKDNLGKSLEQTKRYETINPQYSINLPWDIVFDFGYKIYREEWTSRSTFYRTKTWDYGLEIEYEKAKLTFKPKFTHERKNDLTASFTDEQKKDLSFTLEHDYWDRLSTTYTWDWEHKTFEGASTRAYTERQWSLDMDLELIKDRWDIGAKYTFKDRRNTTTENNQLETLEIESTVTSADGLSEVTLLYEHKNNPYEPNITSAYNRDYFKFVWTREL